MRLADLREQVELVTEAVARARGNVALGTATSLDLRSIFRAAPELATWESWSLVSDAAASAEGKRAVRLKALRHHLFKLLEANATADAVSARLECELSVLAGSNLAARTAVAEVGETDNREQRADLERRAVSVLAAASSAASRELERRQSVAQKAGFATSAQAHAALAGVDLAVWTSEVEAFLTATDAMYDDVLSWWMRRTLGLRLFPHGAERHDLLHAMALRSFAGVFPPRKDLTTFAARLERMGLSRSAEGRIRADFENRAAKDPEAVVIPVHAPREIWLSVRGERGFETTRRFLRGFGAAQHWANIEPERPFEDRMMGDEAIALGFGEALSLCLLDHTWQRKWLEVEVADLPRVAALALLTRARWSAARLLHSLQVDRDGVTATLPKQYSERMSAVLRVAWPAELAFFDADVGLRDGAALRGLSWGHALRSHLIEHFDEDWWSNPRAGLFLKKLFEEGQFTAIPDIATRLQLERPTLASVARLFELSLM
jgi:hypothetical protein